MFFVLLLLLLRSLFVSKMIAAYLMMLASELLLNFSFPLAVHQRMAALNIDLVKPFIEAQTQSPWQPRITIHGSVKVL